MRFQGLPNFKHSDPAKLGILLTNLGTPEAATAKALRPYLKQFLWDPRVVEVPRPLWWLILNGIILNIRPRRSAEAYSEVWTERGSPLLCHTEDQTIAVRQTLQAEFGEHVIVEFAMRYGNPSIESVLTRMFDAGIRKLLVLPLYPQFSGPTTASTFDAVASHFQQRRWLPDFRFVSHYHDHPDYIGALASSISKHWEQHGRADKLIFSYHGEPQRYLEQGDPYHCECHKTTRLVAETLNLNNDEYMTTFQSRFGREPWLQPYTDATLKQLPSQGTKSVQVICPGFSSDCLETIEEIGQENRDYFTDAGGERYEYIDCLNATSAHIDLLVTIIKQHVGDWLDAEHYDNSNSASEAAKLGAKM